VAIFVISAGAIALCILTVIFCRKYINKAFDSVDKVLERVLSKNFDEPLKTTGEDRISKLTHKANRIMDMCVSEVNQSNTEKETIQGFISDMSHQMKTPLAGISMYTELLAEGGLSADDARDFLSRMKISTEKLQWMMESLIKMSRLESGVIALNPANLDIKQTISEAISGILAAANKRNISIAVSDFRDVTLYHDKKWTIEAIGNILENAVKYSHEDSEIAVSVEPLQQHTKIAITNKGEGIPKSDWHLIFKRFYRGQNVKEKEGVGLGLYLVTVIMEKQGGYIMVDSIPGQSATFSLFLQNCKK
jgi:signal transduction histidine kinase